MRKTQTHKHIPVMLDEVVAIMQPERGKTIIDATFGGGGYSQQFLQRGANVIAIDRDPNTKIKARAFKKKYKEKFQFVHQCFSKMENCCQGGVDGVVMDLGLSSMQIENGERGFSFQRKAPLDMRMEQSGLSAENVINNLSQKELVRLIGILGEEKRASKIAAAIVAKRPLYFTSELAKIIEDVVPKRNHQKIHSATKTFQALRIFVNDELNELASALCACEKIIKPHGFLCVVSFHSLEDKIVKKFFKHTSEQLSQSRHLPPIQKRVLTFSLPKKNALKASEKEIANNRRARSARLRYGIRLATTSQNTAKSIFALPNLQTIKVKI